MNKLENNYGRRSPSPPDARENKQQYCSFLREYSFDSCRRGNFVAIFLMSILDKEIAKGAIVFPEECQEPNKRWKCPLLRCSFRSKSSNFMEMIQHLHACDRFPDKLHEFWCPDWDAADHAHAPLKIPCMEQCRCEKKSITGKAAKFLRKHCSSSSSRKAASPSPASPVSSTSIDRATSAQTVDTFYTDHILYEISADSRTVDQSPPYPTQLELESSGTAQPYAELMSRTITRTEQASELPGTFNSMTAELQDTSLGLPLVPEVHFECSQPTTHDWKPTEAPSSRSFHFAQTEEQSLLIPDASTKILDDAPLFYEPLAMETCVDSEYRGVSQYNTWPIDDARTAHSDHPMFSQTLLQTQTQAVNFKATSETRQSSLQSSTSVSSIAESNFDSVTMQSMPSRTTSLDSDDFPQPVQMLHQSSLEDAQVMSPTEDETLNRGHWCPECKENIQGGLQKFKKHLNRHAGGPSTCPHCFLKIKYKYNVKPHIIKKHPEKFGGDKLHMQALQPSGRRGRRRFGVGAS